LKEGELPEPEIVEVTSRLPGTDGINLSCTLFMSANSENPDESKMISPMILVHDLGGSKLDLAPLARHLQSAGHTVLVPDLRGHGRSTTIANQTDTVDYSEFRKSDFATIGQDLEACKRYLMQFNNEGKLNISMLSMLAVGDMCPIVTEWVLRDWSFASRGRLKQGKDVQSLTLVSPKRKFKTFSMSQLVKAPLLSGRGNWHIPTLVIWGSESKSAKETKAVYKAMAKHRPPSEAAMSVDRWAEQDLYKLDLPVAAEGAELLRPNEALYKFIATFNQQKILLNAAQFPWQSRAKKKSK
jgi:pimeloyl-ACP methyl ester carboxylesterase